MKKTYKHLSDCAATIKYYYTLPVSVSIALALWSSVEKWTWGQLL